MTRDPLTALLTAADVAARTQLSLRAAYDLMRSLPSHVRRGRAIRLPAWALDAWIERGGDRNLARPIRAPAPAAVPRNTYPPTRPVVGFVPADAPMPHTEPRRVRKPVEPPPITRP